MMRKPWKHSGSQGNKDSRHQMKPSSAEKSYPWSYEAHRRHQIRRGLELSVVERLRWLETTMASLQNLIGRASEDPRAGHSRR